MTETYSLELSERRPGAPCDACGEPTETARGFIYREGDADAIYFASWSRCAPGRVKLAIAIGDWTDEGGSVRRAVLMNTRSTPAEIQLTVTGTDDSPWSGITVATVLSREEALADAELPRVFAVADVALRDDPDIATHMEG